MNAKQAYAIVKKQYPTREVTQCLEFEDVYAFSMIKKEWKGQLLIGGYITVDKNDGHIGGMNAVRAAMIESKKVPLRTLKLSEA